MRLVRFGPPEAEKPGLFRQDGTLLDVSAFGEDYDEAFFGSRGPERLSAWLSRHSGSCPQAPAAARLGAPIRRPSKIVCVGHNYRAHAEETEAPVPSEPVLFLKAPSAVSGPFDPVVIPRGSKQTDHEVELALVIGDRARYVTRDRALDHVAGYLLMNDYSEREFQRERGGQFTKGKSADTFAPLGPYLVTPDEIDPCDVRLWLKLNDQLRQDASTGDLIFDVACLVSYTSEFMTLVPGDVLSTGTPSGVGLGRNPPRYLRPGDVVEYGARGLGIARQTLVGAER
ncbi:MAG: fumarylacetoacetate hydrolase family protein [Polyangiaceae bacterium]|nr:fumarylacetoacetate hydrolase family protein [Polyangiaceae bacterium]